MIQETSTRLFPINGSILEFVWHNSYMQMRMIIGIIYIFIYLPAWAGEATHLVYQNPENYVADHFEGRVPDTRTLWPSADLRQDLTQILGHKPGLRFKYWGAEGRTVWVLDEVGKDRPITAGIVVEAGKIADVQVLVFRESRGWEIKHNFFTRQFAQMWLDDEHDLSGRIDNITGATLSVKAMTRMAKAALLLHAYTSQNTSALAHAR